MICLSKNQKDEYVNAFAQGAGLPIKDYSQDDGVSTILIRGMGKRKLIWQCWDKRRPFYYMDSGYVGNYPSAQNPQGWKKWHRIVSNDLQHRKIQKRSADRWQRLDCPVRPRKPGKHILLVLPSEKPCKFYGINAEEWKRETISRLKLYTDRPVVVREKQPRQQRIKQSIFQDLDNCHAVVTYQSVAAIESVLYGVPAVTLAPTAADPVCEKNLSEVENPHWEDQYTREKWAHHLAYCQYHISELQNGTAYRMLQSEIG